MDLDDPSIWRTRLLTAGRGLSGCPIDRVQVLAETASTQDAAAALAGGKPGLLVVALQQTSGRGRLGRTWVQRGKLGLAATFVLDPSAMRADAMSLAAGIAAARACEAGLGGACLGLRWPNDVVEAKPGGGRKLAGVLVEVKEGLALVGIGINVLQRAEDFPPELAGEAVSLGQLGSPAERLEVAAALLRELSGALSLPSEALTREWARRDVLMGTLQTFRQGQREVRGIVESIDPAHEIVLRTSEGHLERLAAATATLVRG